MTGISRAPMVMPVAFTAHGNPMDALEVNRFFPQPPADESNI